MAKASPLSLIQILNLLYYQQLSDSLSETVYQAKQFAHKLLARGLEHLDPDARILLLLCEKKVSSGCRLTFQLNLKQLQKKMGWNRERLKSSLEELLRGNYLKKHPKKRSPVYELLYDSAKKRRVDYIMKPQGAMKKTL